MKKMLALLIVMSLSVLSGMPDASAQTTAVDLNGKTYIFYGADGVYEADGITFLIEDQQVTLSIPGEADRVLTLEESQNARLVPGTLGEKKGAACSNEGCFLETEGFAQQTEDVVGLQMNAAQEAASTVTICDAQGRANEIDYAQYRPFGMAEDEEHGILTVQGRRVRVFEDRLYEDNQCIVSVEYFDALGVIDAEGVRDENGRIVGLRVLSDTEFRARDLSDWSRAGDSSACTVEGETLSPAEAAEFYAPYAALGIVYNQTDGSLSCQGMKIRRFLDIRTSNGQSRTGGGFEGTMTLMLFDSGDVDVEIIRDYDRSEANGEGALIGLTISVAE